MNIQTTIPGERTRPGITRNTTCLVSGVEDARVAFGIRVFRRLLVCTMFLYTCGSTLASAGELVMSREAIEKISTEHGDYARRRVDYWQQLMEYGQHYPDMEKLQRVNDFFNEIEFVNDAEHWGKEDYWATPLQTLVSNGGDCEDFSIAKYFTLLEMGIPPDRMRLTYVKALRLDQAHMVLAYYPVPDADPLLLDNLDPSIRSSAKRDDLLPVYSFNVDGLWLAKTQTSDSKHVGKSSRLSPWRDVIARINSEAIP
jgi:predicted transglutaminase-like cysteine proteinase